MRIGVLRNPASTLNRRGPALEIPKDIPVAEPPSAGATEAALADLMAQGVRIIAVDGGDGTVRAALDALARLDALDTVALALLPRGNTNLFHREIGGWTARGDAALLERIASENAAQRIRRRLLRLTTGEASRLGLICGFGAYERATRLAAEGSTRGALGVASAITGALFQALTGGRQGPWRRGVRLSLCHDEGEAHPGDRLLFVATTAEGSLPPGITPFWADDGAAGAIRWLDIAAPGRHLAAAAPFVLAGRPRRWMTRAGYASGRSDRIEISGAASFVLDGEIFDSDPGTTLTIDAATTAEFVIPAGVSAPIQNKAPRSTPAMR